MNAGSNLTNQFLIAMPALADPNFHHTVTYICEHNTDGAMGVVINRPLEIQLGTLLEHLAIPTENDVIKPIPIYQGGPVQPDRGFVLHNGAQQWDTTLQVTENIALTASQDIIHAIARGEGPTQFLIALGYAGWGIGQLEKEIADNAWLSGPADPAIIFQTPEAQRWNAAAALLGVNIDLLSSDAGHA